MFGKLKSSITFWLLLIVCTVLGQDRYISPQQITQKIKLDGKLNELAWKQTTPAKDFQMHYPFDSLQASSQTTAKILFDQQYLYIGAICKNSNTSGYVVQSLKRDFDFRENDAFMVFLDLFNDASGGMAFGVNVKGVQLDGIIPRGGNKGIQLNWDGKWFAEVHQSPDRKYWSVEIKIPLKTLRFSNNNFTWGVNFARNDLANNEVSTWSPVTRGFDIATLAQAGKIQWQKPPPPQNSKITIVPYNAIRTEKSFTDNTSTILKPRVGLDAKVALNSSLNFDFTINPDFSQVEVDQQVIDLNRFELFFPEKRLLFLDNSDLFSGLGNSRVRPYFSRRIGSAGENPVKIHFGARLSGKIKKDVQIGVMSIQTDPVATIGTESQNYSIAAIQKTLMGGSALTAFVANRQGVEGYYIDHKNFNRVGGVEFDFRSPNSLWTGKSFLHYAASDFKNNGGFSYDTKIRYKTRKATIFFGIDAVHENYMTDMGYVPRLWHEFRDSLFRIGYHQVRSNGYYRFFNKKKNNNLDFISVKYDIDIFTDKKDFSYQEHVADLKLIFRFLDMSELTFTTAHLSPRLFFPFTLDGLATAFDVGNYPNRKFSVLYDSGKLKPLYWKGYLGFGGEYMGNRFDFRGEVNYRFQDFITTSLNFSQQNLTGFPDSYGEAKFTLVGSKV
ncbi:MAG: DUF5916 domain-containing protein [Bacteroidota bacterium]